MVVDNYRHIEQQISSLKQANHKIGDVLIVPVSKRKPAEDIRALYEIGVRDFAENYLQEAQQKIEQLSDCTEIQWHYIGKIQSKKCKYLARQMAWVHTVDDFKQATLLDNHCAQCTRVSLLNVCIQVNLHQEEQKNGVAPSELASLSQKIASLNNIRLRGLMLIGKFGLPENEQIESFKQMQKLFQICKRRLQLMENENTNPAENFDTLSMGMSDDWQNALTNGSTIIRLGTTIFGKRETIVNG